MKKKLKSRLVLSLALWVLFADSFLLMKPAVDGSFGSGRMPIVAVGILFWLTLLLALSFMIAAMVCFHRICAKRNIRIPGAPGIIRFFSNPLATAVDIAMLLSLAACFVLFRWETDNQMLYFIDFFFLALTIPWHAIWNGKMMKMTRKKRVVRGNEQ